MIRNVLFVTVLSSFTAFAENATVSMSQQDYVKTWSTVALENMKNYKIPASITLAQGILESGSGNSPLAVQANNHFGIKCSNWNGDKIYFDDDAKGECFRKYPSASDSYKDHSLFLTERTRYASLFELPITDYKAWAKGLKKAGYATHPQYAEKLIDLIDRLKLYEYDVVGVSEPKATDLLVSESKEQKTSKAKVPVANSATEMNALKIDASYLSERKHTKKENKNEVSYITVQKGDTYYKIAKEFGLALRQMYKYNDFVAKKDLLDEGDVVYLEPKRLRAKEKGATYTAKTTISLIEISQAEGIKLKSLVRMNGFTSDQVLVQKGQKILLR